MTELWRNIVEAQATGQINISVNGSVCGYRNRNLINK